MKMSRRAFAAGCVASALAGCERRRESHDSVFSATEMSRQVTIILDLSGSFKEMMAEDGLAWSFTLRCIDKYFRASVGSEDRLVIGQISGTGKLLFEGTPHSLRKDFTSDTFRDLLVQSANGAGSALNAGICHCMEYVMASPRVAAKQVKTAVFILSDMLDTTGETRDGLMRKMAEYGTLGGVVGFYFVDEAVVLPLRSEMAQTGVREYIVESEIVRRPSLPNLE